MIIVCKQFRLFEQVKGKFKVTDMKKEIRSSVKVDEDFVKVSNANSATSGIYYEIDEEATKARNEKLNPSKKEPSEKDILLEKAKGLGLDVDGRTGIDKLRELIAEQEN